MFPADQIPNPFSLTAALILVGAVLLGFALGAAASAVAVILYFRKREKQLHKDIEHLRAKLYNEDERINNVRALCEESLCAQHAQREFLTSISHDLRETLNSMDGVMSEFMVREDLDPSKSEALASLEEAREHLLSKMDDILVYAALEAGSLKHEETSFDPRSILRALEQRLRIAAARRGLAVEWREEPSLPRKVRGDATQFMRCARSIISECRCWHLCSKIRVKVRWNDITNCLEIEATPLRHAEGAAFDLLLQGQQRVGPSPAIILAERIAKWAKGSLTFTPEAGAHYGTLLLEFPLVPEDAPADSQPVTSREFTTKPPNVDEKPITILVVDDNELNRRVLRHILRKAGWKCQEASSGEQALEMLGNEPFDVVLLDVEMPGLSGLEVTQILRQRQPESERSFVIALTAHAQPEDRARCLKAGMDEHIPKPIDATILIDWMRRLQALPRPLRISLSASPHYTPTHSHQDSCAVSP